MYDPTYEQRLGMDILERFGNLSSLAHEYVFFQETDEDRYFISQQHRQEQEHHAHCHRTLCDDIMEDNMSIVDLKRELAHRGISTSLRDLLVHRLKSARAAENSRHKPLNTTRQGTPHRHK